MRNETVLQLVKCSPRIDYAGLRLSQAQATTSFVATLPQKKGDFSDQLDLTSPTGVTDCNGVPTYQGELFNTSLTQASTTQGCGGFCGVPFGYTNGSPSNVIPVSNMDFLGRTLMNLYPGVECFGRRVQLSVRSPHHAVVQSGRCPRRPGNYRARHSFLSFQHER
jgi:hypothetical protein